MPLYIQQGKNKIYLSDLEKNILFQFINGNYKQGKDTAELFSATQGDNLIANLYRLQTLGFIYSFDENKYFINPFVLFDLLRINNPKLKIREINEIYEQRLTGDYSHTANDTVPHTIFKDLSIFLMFGQFFTDEFKQKMKGVVGRSCKESLIGEQRNIIFTNMLRGELLANPIIFENQSN